jgi:hypothetical protein
MFRIVVIRVTDDHLPNNNPWESPWAQWLKGTKKGRRVKGFLDVLSFYLCFVAVMYFMGRLARVFDQRSLILENMPSSISNNGSRLLLKNTLLETCAIEPNDLSSSDDSDDEEEEDEDEFGNKIIWEFGQEDEAYLYQRLSASAYHQVFGQGYRAALFDLPHQLFYNLAFSAVAIYTLRRYFGCSFWDDW